MILSAEHVDQIPIRNPIAIELRKFAREHLLKENDIYTELRNETKKKYKDVNMELLQLQDPYIPEQRLLQSDEKSDPYYAYKNVFKIKKIEYIE